MGVDHRCGRDLIPAQAHVLYFAHNIEYTLYRHQIVKHLSIPLLGRLLVNDASKLEGFELGYAQRSAV